MPQAKPRSFDGIYAATLCPLDASYRIDEQALSDHVAGLASVAGIRGILCNGHAGENFALARAEKRRVVEITRQAAGPDAALVAGVNQESSLEAVEEAREAAAAGADAILVFPPNSWSLCLDAETVVAHHRAVIEAADLPIMLYQAPVTAGCMAYPPELLRRLVVLPRVVAIKEGSWETATYEANRRLVKEISPDVAVMASGDEHLLSSFVLGSEGSLVSLAVIIPETIVRLDQAVRAGDLAAARAAHEVIYPLAKAIYGTAPAGLATARLKACLKLLGRLDSAVMRPPVRSLSEEELARLRTAIEAAGLL
jgi:4-hydroxy-tetrahydrodipicolinate synthase